MGDEEWNEFADDWLKNCSDDIVELAMRAALESVEKEIERQILLMDIRLIRMNPRVEDQRDNGRELILNFVFPYTSNIDIL